MKKLLVTLMCVAMVLALMPAVAFAQEDYVAEYNGNKYSTLIDAVGEALKSETATEIKLLKDASGGGIFIGANEKIDLTIDFCGKTYTLEDPAVGSPGYESQGFHLEKGNKVTLKNGTIEVSTASKGTKMMIQNYCDLTLTDMNLNGEEVKGTYILSNNNGTILLNGNTTIATKEGQVAFDVYDYRSNGYSGVNVTVDTTGIINGKIEVGGSGQNPDPKLIIKNGVFNSIIDKTAGVMTVLGGTFASNVEKYVAEGYEAVKVGEKYVVAPKATGITLDKTSASVEVGKTVSLKATVTPAETLDTVAWTTSDATVATVKDGVVTAVAPGAATITATVNGKTATFKVSVYKVAEPPKVDNVDTTKPVEEVKPVVKQETVVKATEEAKAVISDIAEGKNTTAVSKETKAKVKAALDDGKTITTEVVVETVKEETVKDDAKKADALLADSNVKKEIGEAKIAQYLNLEIVLKADGQELGTINELSEKMTFTIAVPEELKGKNRVFYVVRVHNGEAEILPTTMNADGTISFTTDKFSTYALAYADPATTTPKTGDATNMLPWLALMAVAGAGAVVFKKKED